NGTDIAAERVVDQRNRVVDEPGRDEGAVDEAIASKHGDPSIRTDEDRGQIGHRHERQNQWREAVEARSKNMRERVCDQRGDRRAAEGHLDGAPEYVREYRRRGYLTICRESEAISLAEADIDDDNERNDEAEPQDGKGRGH